MKSSVPAPLPANDASHSPEDIRDQLRRDHDTVLAQLDALRSQRDERRGLAQLRELRQAWVTHALAEETVVYRALEGRPVSERSDERFIEHELVGGLFDKLTRLRPGSLEWNARLNVVGEIMRRHIEAESGKLFARLERVFDAEALRDMGENFRLAREKLALLERLKAA